MAQEDPLISVIINCKNGEKYLFESVNSVLNQSYENFEIIFFDNNSVDKSKEIIESFQTNKIKYFHSDQNLLLGEARNLALSKASGEYITFLDTDDIYLKERLFTQLLAMQQENYEVSYSGYFEINKKGEYLKEILPRISSGNIFEKTLKRYNVNLQTIMLKKELIDRLKVYFDKSLNFSEDGDFFLNIIINEPVLVLRKPLIKYRIHPDQDTRKKYNLVAKEFKITLNKLKLNYPEKYIKYKKAFNFAFIKLTYFEFLDILINGNLESSLEKISKIKFKDIRYFLIWIFLNFTKSKKLTLKILNRKDEK